MQSAFTIRVGEKQADGARDVSVLHRGEVHFSTSHQNVKWAFLTRFPVPSREYNSLMHSSDASPDDKMDYSDVCGNAGSGEETLTTWNNSNSVDSGRVMQEYLCVFYCDEPKNRLSHYAAHQPSTICSAYNTLDPAVVTHFVLKNISPTSVVPGVRGVFVHGSRQSSRGVSPQILRIGGCTFHQAANLWWMASQLTIRPVYVPVGENGPKMDLPINNTAAMVLPLWYYNNNNLKNTSGSPSYSGGAVSGNVTMKYALIEGTVVSQFQACDGKQIVVVVCGDEVCLAATTVLEHLDVLLWVWWPQRLQLPRLCVKGASVSVTVSENLLATTQILFLFDASQAVLHALRTPDLQSGNGNLELMFTVSTNCPPVVLPCLSLSMVQPIMVCHKPAVNEVTLYHVPSLLQNSSPSSYLATMSLAKIIPDDLIINGILYQTGSTVVFHVAPRCGDNEGKLPGVSFDKKRTTYTFSFPSLLEEQHPLTHFMLEALEPVLKLECVASLQCELLRRAWKSTRLSRVWDFGSECIELIADIVRLSTTGIRNSSSNSDASLGISAANSGGFAHGEYSNTVSDSYPQVSEDPAIRLSDVVVDPFLLTADLLQRCYLPVSTTHEDQGRSELSYKISASQFWTQHQCGLAVFTLHLLCESFRLQERLWTLLEPLAKLNLRLSQMMGWVQYVRYYSTSLCVPEAADIVDTSPATSPLFTSQTFQCSLPSHVLFKWFVFHGGASTEAVLNGSPPLLYTILQRVLEGKIQASGGWPAMRYVSHTNPLSMANRLFFLFVDCFDAPRAMPNLAFRWWYLLCRGLLKYGIDPKFVSSELCVGVAQPIERALAIAKDHPEDVWDDDFNAIIGRLDRLRHTPTLERYSNLAGDVLRAAQERAIGRQYRATLNDDDGVIMRPDFPKHWGDSRLDIVQTMFNTAAPIALPNQVDGADAIYTSLKTFSRRATALPVGRGIFTLCSQNFRVRDSVPIPRLNLEGRTSDGITIANNSEEASANNIIWPLFHNGCAAGLRFLPLPHFKGHESVKGEQSITRHWILYQTRNIACPASRSGLLLAAGLLGHLKVLQRTDIYSLLVFPQSQFSGREVVTISVMLGLSCSLRGTCNAIVFNCLSMHVQSLTPAAEDIEVLLDVQTAALVSIGILHQQSPDAFLVEMLLIQMSRLPTDEHFRDREGYALGAGFGLGLLLLGIGSSHGISNVENRLLRFMEGARREAVPSACEGLENFKEFNPESGHFLTQGLLARNAKDSFQNHCTRVYEGDCFNIAVSGPAAIVALGFMYMQTDDASMAIKVAPVNRLVGLQGIYPEHCLLRSMMSCLIMWSQIEPSGEWLRQSIPSCLLRLAKSPLQSGLVPAQIRFLMMNLGHCLAGAVLALGLRFAGSMDADAKAIVLAELVGFMRGCIGTTGAVITAIHRSTGAFQVCISACAVALALIMAGTGDGQCFAVMRKLYNRSDVKYGDHLSVSMATGLLFIGGGQLTLSSSLSSVAALIMSFYPIWPESASDNKMHLQALRHLYCLAVVPRAIETVDVLTNRAVSVPVRVIVHRGRLGQNEPSSIVKELWTPLPKGKEDQAVRMLTPCLLPESSTVSQIEIRSPQHYNLTIYNTGPNVIGDGGMVVRVLEKNAVNTRVGESARSPGEELVVDWILRLFHEQPQRRPRPIEATVILDNMNLLFASQECFPTEFGSSEREFSLDFVMNVRRTLERRYGGLLKRSGVFSSLHPFSHIVMMRKSVYSTAVSLVQSLTSGSSYPRELTSVAESLHAYIRATEPVDASDKVNITVPPVARWLSQTLHFYGLGGSTWPLGQALANYTLVLQKRGQRFLALYHMNQELFLRPQVLEDLVDCCVEYVD